MRRHAGELQGGGEHHGILRLQRISHLRDLTSLDGNKSPEGSGTDLRRIIGIKLAEAALDLCVSQHRRPGELGQRIGGKFGNAGGSRGADLG